MIRRLVSACAVLGLVVIGTALAPAALAGDCWGCHQYHCMTGFDAGGLFCEETTVSCGFVYKLLGIDCEARSCSTSGACHTTLGERTVNMQSETCTEGGKDGWSR